MIATLAGVLFVTASAAGWLLMVLLVVDAVRYHRRLRAWRPDPPKREDLP